MNNKHLTSVIKAESVLKIIANKHRLLILCKLKDAPACVNELSDFLHLSQPSTSQHLAIMRKEDIVTTKQEQQTIYYYLKSQSIVDIINVLYLHYCQPIDDDNNNIQYDTIIAK